MSVLLASDLFLKTVDEKGNVTATAHRVWDRRKFFAAREADAKREGGKVSMITEQEYRNLK